MGRNQQRQYENGIKGSRQSARGAAVTLPFVGDVLAAVAVAPQTAVISQGATVVPFTEEMTAVHVIAGALGIVVIGIAIGLRAEKDRTGIAEVAATTSCPEWIEQDSV